jgi:hypothetical protein
MGISTCVSHYKIPIGDHGAEDDEGHQLSSRRQQHYKDNASVREMFILGEPKNSQLLRSRKTQLFAFNLKATINNCTFTQPLRL